MWFELPEDIPASEKGSPWLALMRRLAVASGEDLDVELYADRYCIQNAGTLPFEGRFRISAVRSTSSSETA